MGNMKANRKFGEGEDAVSAVIGVILMVAITVAIAATVYVYVSGIISGPVAVQPSITFQIQDDGDVDAQAGSPSTYSAAGDVVFTLEHFSGDKITMADVNVQYKSDNVTTWTTIDDTGVADGLKFGTSPTYFEIGDSIELQAVDGDTPAGDYLFRIIHKPSQSQVLTESSFTAE